MIADENYNVSELVRVKRIDGNIRLSEHGR